MGKFTGSDLSLYDTNNCQRGIFYRRETSAQVFATSTILKPKRRFLQFNLFGIFVKVFFGQCVGPVLKSLPYYW